MLTKKKRIEKNNTSTIGGRRVSCLHFTAFSSKQHDGCDGKNAVDATRRTQAADSYITIASSANKLYSVPSPHRRTSMVKLFYNVFTSFLVARVHGHETHTALLFRRGKKRRRSPNTETCRFPLSGIEETKSERELSEILPANRKIALHRRWWSKIRYSGWSLATNKLLLPSLCFFFQFRREINKLQLSICVRAFAKPG